MSTRREGRTVGVLTVDDQAISRTAMRAAIDATPGFEAVGEAASGEDALRVSATQPPDLALVDIRMPGMDGIETARRLAAAHPDVVVVLVSLDDPVDVALMADTCSAAAFVRKQDLSPKLLKRLWAAHRRP
jgi:DNA-binding NarL/FixJ family response regulator